MSKGQNRLTIKKIVNYCPQCDNVPDRGYKTNENSIAVARECEKHRPKFVKTGTGIMVPKSFLGKFKEMIRPVSLSSQEI